MKRDFSKRLKAKWNKPKIKVLDVKTTLATDGAGAGDYVYGDQFS
jgi:hypothetical protein